jgi:hypothetical protein
MGVSTGDVLLDACCWSIEGLAQAAILEKRHAKINFNPGERASASLTSNQR